MDPFIIFLTVVISILTLVLAIAGVQVILILRNINKSLNRFNQTLDYADHLLHSLSNPLSDIKAMGQGVKTGLHVAEHIVSWIRQKQSDTEDKNE